MTIDAEDGHLQNSWVLLSYGNTWHTSLIHWCLLWDELSAIHLHGSPFPVLVIYGNEP